MITLKYYYLTVDRDKNSITGHKKNCFEICFNLILAATRILQCILENKADLNFISDMSPCLYLIKVKYVLYI